MLTTRARGSSSRRADGRRSRRQAVVNDGRQRRVLIVSHPAVVSVNQLVYRELAQRGWEVTIVLPNRWRHPYAQAPIAPSALPGMEDALRPTRVVFAGKQQRHVYLTSAKRVIKRIKPDVAFVEAEPYALVSTQWGRAFAALDVPFGVQCYENIDRSLPAPVRRLRARVLGDATFVAARSDTAGRLARAWGARGTVDFAPPAVPMWERTADARARTGTCARTGTQAGAHSERTGEQTRGERRDFTIGFAGRLVPSKGLDDLLAAVRTLEAPVQLLLLGDGELRERLDGEPIPGSRVRVVTGLKHEGMADAYGRLDVLALPSRTTATWKEQFGRVIVEALSCGVPVVGSDSGEIPWLIELTGGGLVFPEGDRAALAARLAQLRGDPGERARLAAAGGAAVQRLFTVAAATDRFEGLLEGAARRPG